MEAEGREARIQHRIAELRCAHSRIHACHAALEAWHEGAEPLYALQLDIRWPQHQSLVSGPARASPDEAVEAGFERAARVLEGSHA